MSEAVKKAFEVIEKNKIPAGIKAGYYYPDFWCRDALISVLGFSFYEELHELAKKCLKTCIAHQKFTGQIPNKITPNGVKAFFGEGGCVDSSLWLPIASFYYLKNTDDKKFISRNLKKIEKAVKWAINLDLNNDWLIETHDGSDWMDMLVRNGRVLYDNVLFYAALKHLHMLFEEFGKKSYYLSIAELVKGNINLLLWLDAENTKLVEKLYGYTGIEKDYQIALREGEKPYYIAELGFRKYDARFDVFANTLAVFFDIPDEEKKKKILEAFESYKVAEPYPIRVLIPPIPKQDPFWCFYFRETELTFLQEPGAFHNGACWPFAGGFFTAMLKKEKLKFKCFLEKLEQACMLEEGKFYEWIHAFTSLPGGSPEQTWSAAMLLFAEKYR